jgi:hypothetical protein
MRRACLVSFHLIVLALGVGTVAQVRAQVPGSATEPASVRVETRVVASADPWIGPRLVVRLVEAPGAVAGPRGEVRVTEGAVVARRDEAVPAGAPARMQVLHLGS